MCNMHHQASVQPGLLWQVKKKKTTKVSALPVQKQPGQHATAHMQSIQPIQKQQQAPKDEGVSKPGNPGKQRTAHAEVEELTQALRGAEQRASAAELAVLTVQRTHTEAVEQSARLQASCTLACITAFHLSIH